MADTQEIRAILLAHVKKLDTGFACVSQKMGCTERNLRALLNPEPPRKTRLKTLQRIKDSIEQCQSDENKKKAELLL